LVSFLLLKNAKIKGLDFDFGEQIVEQMTVLNLQILSCLFAYLVFGLAVIIIIGCLTPKTSTLMIMGIYSSLEQCISWSMMF